MGDFHLQMIVDAVADEKGIEPNELDFSLYDHIDPDAIKRLMAHESAPWMLSFELPNHIVTVTNEGVVFVESDKRSLEVPPTVDDD